MVENDDNAHIFVLCYIIISFKAENKKFPSVYLKMKNSKLLPNNGFSKSSIRTFSTDSNSYFQQMPLKNTDSGKDIYNNNNSASRIENSSNEVIRINRSSYIEKIQTPIPQYSDYGNSFMNFCVSLCS